MTQQSIDNLYIDWLGSYVSVGDWVLYSSKSTNVGMNLGKVEYVGPAKKPGSGRKIIQVRIFDLSIYRSWSKGKLVTLSSGDGAYRSVTKYPDTMVPFDEEVEPAIERAVRPAFSKIIPGAKKVPSADFVCDLGPEEPEARDAAIQDWEETNRYPD